MRVYICVHEYDVISFLILFLFVTHLVFCRPSVFHFPPLVSCLFTNFFVRNHFPAFSSFTRISRISFRIPGFFFTSYFLVYKLFSFSFLLNLLFSSFLNSVPYFKSFPILSCHGSILMTLPFAFKTISPQYD